jgi:hypothetical protein
MDDDGTGKKVQGFRISGEAIAMIRPCTLISAEVEAKGDG